MFPVLENLDLSGNKIEDISNSIENLSRIKNLNLGRNQLVEVRETIKIQNG